ETFLCNFNPDVVIATHFLASDVISNLKKVDRLKTKLITCVTDFRMHSFWFAEQTDYFCVGFLETQMDLIRKWGVSPKKINIVGIPIHSKFYEAKNKEDVCNRLHLSKEVFTILITGGGFGVGPIKDLLKVLIRMKDPFQILIVCGHNAKLREEIDKVITHTVRLPTIVKTFGFVDYIDELMSISDVCITKAGGLISSEALAKELPLIISSPIPGQEGRNCRLLLLNKAAFRLNRTSQLKKIIKKIYSNDRLRRTLIENIRKIKKQNPTMNISKFALSI
ncbi:MAG: hypothetical protein NC828_00580, partial [Candidatus Omnitrophica bacterium]|nr:hypothetical protein [Candidatus Omnitrophota bacterium]